MRTVQLRSAAARHYLGRCMASTGVQSTPQHSTTTTTSVETEEGKNTFNESEEQVQPSSSFVGRLGSTWRRVKHDLQTSPRTKAQLKESANQRKMAAMERDRVHWVNDTFMKEGKNGLDSVDERTLEKGLNWAFMFPFCLLSSAVIGVIMFFSRRGRDDHQNSLRNALEARYARRQQEEASAAAAHGFLVQQLHGTSSGKGPEPS